MDVCFLYMVKTYIDEWPTTHDWKASANIYACTYIKNMRHEFHDRVGHDDTLNVSFST